MALTPIFIAVLLGILVCVLTVVSVCVYWHAVNIAPLFEKKRRLQEEVESLQNTQSDLKAELANMNAERAEAQRIIADGQAMKEYIDANRDTEARLRAQIAAAQEALKDAEDKRHIKEEELQKTYQDLQTAAGENQKLNMENERLRRENEEHTGIIEGLKREIARFQEEKAVAAHQADEAKEMLLKLQSDINERNNEITRLDNEIARKNVEYGTLVDRNAKYERGIEETRKSKEEYERKTKAVMDELDNLNKEIVAKRAELRAVIDQIGTARPENEKIRWGDLDRPVFEIISSKKKPPREDKWLPHFKDMLDQNGIKFHDRMIYAFHTGLKVADYSPLVVLAGISGTGKSLLPRLYAKALGMNFLQIAVQPRWDNPQDMFGFYNYMEGRYKATELSRMLWQFDIYNNPAAKKYEGRLPMNLVLLDEMNLAKVEYYFSDMLSKLEVRRGVNVGNDASRRNAEIEIECGALQEKDHAKRLFVGRNTLFVGTMNEDESTQSLSDKVIDRSNVLRFGRPASLESRSKVEDFESAFEDVPQMTFSEWETSWLKQEPKEADRLEKELAAINEQLAAIGRPFAYRMYGAIRAYVANYPVSGDQGFRDALADQIEMKVLPKLNGVEKESSQRVKNALDNIGGIIEKLNDEQLTNAFNDAKDDRDAVFFQWRGVTR